MGRGDAHARLVTLAGRAATRRDRAWRGTTDDRDRLDSNLRRRAQAGADAPRSPRAGSTFRSSVACWRGTRLRRRPRFRQARSARADAAARVPRIAPRPILAAAAQQSPVVTTAPSRRRLGRCAGIAHFELGAVDPRSEFALEEQTPALRGHPPMRYSPGSSELAHGGRRAVEDPRALLRGQVRRHDRRRSRRRSNPPSPLNTLHLVSCAYNARTPLWPSRSRRKS